MTNMTNTPFPFTDKHKELITEYLLEGNNRTDLADLLYEYLPESEKIKILDEIDNQQLEQDSLNHITQGEQ